MGVKNRRKWSELVQKLNELERLWISLVKRDNDCPKS